MRSLIVMIVLTIMSTALLAQFGIHETTNGVYYQQKKIHNNGSVEIYPELFDKVQKGLFVVNILDGTIWVQDSILYYIDEGTNWLLEERRDKILVRDELGNMMNAISHFYNENAESWTNKDIIYATYHDSDTLFKYWKQPWNSIAQQWSDTSYCFENDEYGNLLAYFKKNWNYTTNEFESGFKLNITYNNGDRLYDIYYGWNVIAQEWYLTQKWDYTYDEGNIDQIIVQSWNSNIQEWENSSQSFFTYDDNGLNTEELRQNWNSATLGWQNYKLYLYTYDENGNRTEQHFLNWNNNTEDWENAGQYLYTFDSNGNMVHYLYQYWNSNIEEWEYIWQSLYTFDENGNKTQQLFQNWNGGTEEWENSNKKDYYWSEFEITNIAEIENNGIKIYPNPAINIIKIPPDIILSNPEVEIFSVSGKLMLTSMINDENEIDIKNLSRGVYFISIYINQEHIVKRFVKK